jgi:hypothetical protein
MDQIERDRLINESLERFERIMAIRTELNLGIARRVSFLMRSSFIGFGLVVGAFFFMILVLSTQMDQVTTLITTMNTHFSSMNDDMDYMLSAMAEMDHHVGHLPRIVSHMDGMYHDMQTIALNMAQIHQDMVAMTGDLGQLGGNVTDMRHSFRGVDTSVQIMRQDVQHMSAPMRMFNFFNPMR